MVCLFPAGHPPSCCTEWKQQNAEPLGRFWKRLSVKLQSSVHGWQGSLWNLGASVSIYYFAIPDKKREREWKFISIYTVLKVLFKNTMQYCLGNLVCIVREWSGKQRNGELTERRKLKLKRLFKLLRWNPPGTLPSFTDFVYLDNQWLKAVSCEFNRTLEKLMCLFCWWLRACLAPEKMSLWTACRSVLAQGLDLNMNGQISHSWQKCPLTPPLLQRCSHQLPGPIFPSSNSKNAYL